MRGMFNVDRLVRASEKSARHAVAVEVSVGAGILAALGAPELESNGWLAGVFGAIAVGRFIQFVKASQERNGLRRGFQDDADS